MDDFVVVQIDEGVHNLPQVILDFDFRQSLSALDELIKCLVGAHFQQDVNVLVIFEHVLELYNVLVAQWLVNLYLSDQLHEDSFTFCLARERFRELFAIILAAETRFVYRLVTS